MTKAIYDLSLPELESTVEGLGFEPYRARQVWDWAYRQLASSYDAMSNVPGQLRSALSTALPFPTLVTRASRVSDDGQTRKRLVELADGQLIETVLMLYDPREDARGRATVCVSSQAGCAMGCTFCATGQAGFDRNLTTGEIVAQVIDFAREQRRSGGQPITNVVFMGMGEPMANYGAVWAAVERLTDADGFNMAARHITISTVGHVAGIHRLADEGLQVGLAVSLHAPNDELRQELIPTASRYPLAEIMRACAHYFERTHRRVTFEYCLMAGVNDSVEQAQALGELVRSLNCHVNLIPVNPTPDDRIRRPSRSATLAFERALRERGVACTVRVEKGVEISAACGQLRAPSSESLPKLVPLPLQAR